MLLDVCATRGVNIDGLPRPAHAVSMRHLAGLTAHLTDVYTWDIRYGGTPMMVAKVQKWGNSQGLRLSKHVLDLADIAVGDDVEIIVGDHQILVKKARHPKYDLGELVSRIPEGYKVEEVDFGAPVGREEW